MISIICSHLQVYRKSYKEFTDLRLVQQLSGHSGVVWALKFSRNGRFLASGACCRCVCARACVRVDGCGPCLGCPCVSWPLSWLSLLPFKLRAGLP